MKILLTCDPEIPVPPINYGGIERIADALISSYTSLGHQVYLIANSESNSTKAVEIYGWPVQKSRGLKSVLKNGLFLAKIVKNLKPDIIHSFSRLMYLYPTLVTDKVPFLQSYQRQISKNSTSAIAFLAGKRISFSACAGHMFANLPVRDKFHCIYNFTSTDYFYPNSSLSHNYLMFLGRIEDIKGTKECIEVALACNTPLIIAGNVEADHDEYFNQYVKPHLTNPLIKYIGPVNDEQKRNYLQNAKVFLFPIKWDEPFGIVMAEAMACGVPVIGFRRGSVPEVVINGVNGFIIDTKEEMIGAISKIDQIDRQKVRQDCLTRFSTEKITNQYLELLETIIKTNR